MSKYSSNTIYLGNIIKKRNGIKEQIYKNVELIYDERTDAFYTLDKLYTFVDLDINKDLTDCQLENYKRFLKEGKMSYIPNDEGIRYVDETSITILLDRQNIKKH